MDSWLQLGWLLSAFFSFVPSISAQLPPGPPLPENIQKKTTSFLDQTTPIKGFFGQTFLQQNIPFIDIPDKGIADVYYYRWSSLQRHLRYTVAGTGYIITESVQPQGYATTLNTIDAAAGHQIDEARWLRSNFYNDDYIQAYTRGPGSSTQYSHWIFDALKRRSEANGDKTYASGQLEDMVRLWDLWNNNYDKSAGLYFSTPGSDGQDYSLPGYVVAPYSGRGVIPLQRDGPTTYRPSHNSYMVANAKAIADVAGFTNATTDVTSKFTATAKSLEESVYKTLWDPVQKFFVDVIRSNNPTLSPVKGREAVGLFPFRFGVGLESKYNTAAKSLFDPKGFLAPYGPTTLEVRNQFFDAKKAGSAWNGKSWPFSTAHVLKSIAAIYRSGNSSITADQYVQYLRTYAATQQKNGKPYVAESHNPYENAWSADSFNHSEHYDHSTNNDDVITGLLGIVPRSDEILEIAPIIPESWKYFAIESLPYHGHLITVLYDADGSRYKCGATLCVYVDGEQVFKGNRKYPIHEKIPLATVPVSPFPMFPAAFVPVNLAANPYGVGYPAAEASYTHSADSPYKAIDGYLFYDSVPDNRWTNYQSKNENDTLKVTFARPRNISSVTLAIYSDVARGGSVDVPASIEIYGSGGLLYKSNGTSFLANDKNTFAFAATAETLFVSVNMFNKKGSFVGVCELEIWNMLVLQPYFFAADALLTNANVVFDKASNITSNGAVAGNLSPSSQVAFSGDLPSRQVGNLTLYYSNTGSTSVNIDLKLNQVTLKTVSLDPTGGKYLGYVMPILLPIGKNFITLVGGSRDLKYELITLEGDDPNRGQVPAGLKI